MLGVPLVDCYPIRFKYFKIYIKYYPDLAGLKIVDLFLSTKTIQLINLEAYKRFKIDL